MLQVNIDPPDCQCGSSNWLGNDIKRHYAVVAAGTTAVIDEFFFDNEGLLIVEFESQAPLRNFEPPPWCGREVTSDRRYDNEALVQHPWGLWRHKDRVTHLCA